MPDVAVATPAAPSAGGEFSSVGSGLDSILSNSSPVADVPAPETGAEQEASPDAETPDAVLPEPDEPVAEPEAAETAEEHETPPTTEEADEGILGRGPKQARIDRARFDNTIYPGYKAWQQVREFAPTPEVAREHFESATGYRNLLRDLGAGKVDDIAGFFADQYPRGFAALAQKMPEMLQRMDPSGYQTVQAGMVSAALEARYQKALESGDTQALYQTQMADYALTGAYREAGDIKRRDPIAEERASIERDRQSLQQERAGQLQQAWSQVKADQFDAAKEAAINEVVDEALGAQKKGYEKFPAAFNALRAAIRQDLEKKVGENLVWNQNRDLDMQDVQAAFTNAWQQRQRIDLAQQSQSYKKQFQDRAKLFIDAIARPIIRESNNKLVSDSNARHAQLASSQQKKAPVTPGAPPRQGFSPQFAANADLGTKLNTILKRPPAAR